MPIAITYEAYLTILNKGVGLVLEGSLKSMRLHVEENTEPFAYLETTESVYVNGEAVVLKDYTPLYDMTGSFNLIKPNDWATGSYTYRKYLSGLKISENELTDDDYGYVMQNGTFYRAVNIERLLPSGLVEVNPKSSKYIMAHKLEDLGIDIECLPLKYLAKDNYGIKGLYAREDVFTSTGKKKFKKSDVASLATFPYVFNYFFSQFKNGYRFGLDSPLETGDFAGYTNTFEKVYDVLSVLSDYGPLIKNKARNKELEVTIPVSLFRDFDAMLPPGYHKHLKLVGLSDTNELIIEGPNTSVWSYLTDHIPVL